MTDIFLGFLNRSLAAGILILAVVLVRLVFKKAPRWLLCALWALAAVRLVCPISLQSPVSAYQVAAPTAVQKSGQVGAAPKLKIRGSTTVLGSQAPLWVLDGVILSDPVNVDPQQINDLDFVNL